MGIKSQGPGGSSTAQPIHLYRPKGSPRQEKWERKASGLVPVIAWGAVDPQTSLSQGESPLFPAWTQLPQPHHSHAVACLSHWLHPEWCVSIPLPSPITPQFSHSAKGLLACSEARSPPPQSGPHHVPHTCSRSRGIRLPCPFFLRHKGALSQAGSAYSSLS